MPNTAYVDQIIHGDLTAAYIQSVTGFFANGSKITGVGTATDPSDAATKAQLDALIHIGAEAPTDPQSVLWVEP